MGMDDVNPLSTGKTEWVTFLESASEFALNKILYWGFQTAPVERLKQAEVWLVKAFLAEEEYYRSLNDVASISLVGVQSITTRSMKPNEFNSVVKSFMDKAYSILSEYASSSRDYVVVV